MTDTIAKYPPLLVETIDTNASAPAPSRPGSGEKFWRVIMRSPIPSPVTSSIQISLPAASLSRSPAILRTPAVSPAVSKLPLIVPSPKIR